MRRGRGKGTLDGLHDHARPAAHHNHTIGQKERFVHRVGHHQRRQASLQPYLLQLEIHAPPGDRVECAKGLIEQQQRGFKTERAGNRGALAHAAGELAGPRLFEALQTNQINQMLHPCGVNRAAGNLEGQRDVGLH